MADGRKLLKLAYIFGANASGKTTILKAFDFLREILLEPVKDKAQGLSFDPFLFQENAYTQPSDIELSFYIDEIRYVYSVSFTKFSILEERLVFYQTARPAELFSRRTDPEKRLTRVHFGSRIKVRAREKDLLESNTLHNNTVLGAYARTNVDIPDLEVLNKWFNAYFLGMVTSTDDLPEITARLIDRNPAINAWINAFLHKADNQIIKVLVRNAKDPAGKSRKDAFQNRIQNPILQQSGFPGKAELRVLAEETADAGKFYQASKKQRIEFLHKMGSGEVFALPIQKESSGTKRYFGLGGPLYELIHGSHLLCIDDLDTALHPGLMKHFLQVFLMNSTRSQLLITTHNLTLLDDVDFIRRDALWFSEKESDGAVSLFSVADFPTTTLRKDASLINAYRTGKLGARPNLGSPTIIIAD